jgi:hypothetical protein
MRLANVSFEQYSVFKHWYKPYIPNRDVIQTGTAGTLKESPP